MNIELLWKFPVSATGLVRAPLLIHHPRRMDEIRFSVEDDSICQERVISLLFSDVQASKCTYMMALQVPMIEFAYGQLVAIKRSDWLREVADAVVKYKQIASGVDIGLHHMMITFDDGPCYEFVARGWEVASNSGMVR